METASEPMRDAVVRPGEPPPSWRTWRWLDRALAWLTPPLGWLLDYGCGEGALLEVVKDYCDEAHGVDVDAAAIAEARKRCPTCRFDVIGLDGRTSYPDESFDTVTLIEVIEHVPDERATLNEVARLLRPGGRLLLTTPHAGLLTFLDPGNLKFVFPRLHRFVHRRVLRDDAYYQRRFEQTAQIGLIGDISTSRERRPWHRHYRQRRIESFAPASLRVRRAEVFFPGLRAFLLLGQMFRVLSAGRIRDLPGPLRALERRASRLRTRLGDQLVMEFTRV